MNLLDIIRLVLLAAGVSLLGWAVWQACNRSRRTDLADTHQLPIVQYPADADAESTWAQADDDAGWAAALRAQIRSDERSPAAPLRPAPQDNWADTLLLDFRRELRAIEADMRSFRRELAASALPEG